MATLTVSYAAGENTGSSLRALAKTIEQIAGSTPDVVSSGAPSVLTIDNAPATGKVSVIMTSGPYATTPALISG